MAVLKSVIHFNCCLVLIEEGPISKEGTHQGSRETSDTMNSMLKLWCKLYLFHKLSGT